MSSSLDDEALQGLLASLVEQFRSLASRIAGDPEREVACHFCGSRLPLWENLLVLQLTGVGAHVQCPPDLLAAKLREVGPSPEFPYEEFSSAVEERLKSGFTPMRSGVIELGPAAAS
jgi:hypothetical protein